MQFTLCLYYIINEKCSLSHYVTSKILGGERLISINLTQTQTKAKAGAAAVGRSICLVQLSSLEIVNPQSCSRLVKEQVQVQLLLLGIVSPSRAAWFEPFPARKVPPDIIQKRLDLVRSPHTYQVHLLVISISSDCHFCLLILITRRVHTPLA